MRKSIALFSIIFLFFFLSRAYFHFNLKTEYFDQYFFDNPLWNITRGRILQDSVNGLSGFSGHFSPIFFIFALPYYIVPSPFWMFAFQALFVAGLITLIYSFAQKNLPPPEARLILFLLLTNVTLRYMGLNDFHMDVVVAFFLTLALYLLYSNYHIFLTSLILLSGFAVKETTGPLFASFGLFLLLFRKKIFAGALLFATGAAITVFLIKFVLPRFQPAGIYEFSSYYSQFGNNVIGQLLNMAVNPIKTLGAIFTGQNLLYIFLLIAPLGLLPLFYPSVLTVGLLPLLLNLLSGYRFQKDITTQYQYVLMPVLFFAVIMAIKSLQENNSWPAIKTRVMPAIRFFAVLSITAFILLQLRSYIPSPKTFSAQKIFNLIPKTASVSASSRLITHFQYREHLALFPDLDDAEFVIYEDIDWWLWNEKGDDYAKLKKLWRQRSYGRFFNYIFMGVANPDPAYVQAIKHLSKSRQYKLIASDNGILLFRRKATANYVQR